MGFLADLRVCRKFEQGKRIPNLSHLPRGRRPRRCSITKPECEHSALYTCNRDLPKRWRALRSTISYSNIQFGVCIFKTRQLTQKEGHQEEVRNFISSQKCAQRFDLLLLLTLQEGEGRRSCSIYLHEWITKTVMINSPRSRCWEAGIKDGR